MNSPSIRTYYELQPMFSLGQAWQVWLALASLTALLVLVVWMSLRDSRSLPGAISSLFLVLRISVIAGLILFVLNPGQRSETTLVKDSRLPLLIDTSLSMGLEDQPSSQPAGSQSPESRRIDGVLRWLNDNQSNVSLQQLRQHHEVLVYKFGESNQPELIETFPKQNSLGAASKSTVTAKPFRFQTGLRSSRIWGWIAIGLLLLSGGLAFVWLASLLSTSREFNANVFFASVVMMLAGITAAAVADLRSPEFDLATSLGWKQPNPSALSPPPLLPASDPDTVATVGEPIPDSVQWNNVLAPRGTSTRLGAAIQSVINKERGGPIAAMVVITDGGNNAGVPPNRTIAASANAGIPIYPVGIGSIEVPKNVKVVDVQAPPRVFPSDKFQIKGLIKANGMEGTTIGVQLVSVDEKNEEAETLESETTVRLLGDGEGVPVEFNVSQQDQGKRRYIVRAATPTDDLDPRDNERGAVVEVVDRQTQLLLIAGGPTREFRFLRNQLYRDTDINSHVWLQSAQPGADQEANELLDDFPDTREELFQFDCIVAIDPDWRTLTSQQADLLERWVAEQAGGLIVIAGPVNTPEWTRKPRGDEAIDKIRRLYPVSFYSQGSAQLKLGRFGGTDPFPLDFSREGRAAEFLWLGDSATQSQSRWGQFEGVYGYYAVNEPKSGADVLANFADDSTTVDDRLPIYLASQFYGAGRVFFQASGEMWRVRRLDVEYFQEYYTKLIRWASQGRLLRDSTRGVLLTDRQRCWMGDPVSVQAILRDLQDQPLTAKEVKATLRSPDGVSRPIILQASKNAVRPGSFTGNFSASQEGEYRISLPIPDSTDLDVLTAVVQSSIPDLEKEKPQRNDALLTEMAEKTHGNYYIGMEQFTVPATDPLSPLQLIQPQDQETFLTGTLNADFQRKLMTWLLGLITTLLAIEWTVRRLYKLA